MARLPLSQRALACVLGLVRALAAIVVIAAPFAVFMTGDVYTSVNVPVKSNGGVFTMSDCANKSPEELDRPGWDLKERCEQARNVSMDRGTYAIESNDGLGRYYVAAIPSVIMAIAVFVVASLLLKVLQSVQERDPFSHQNAGRLSKAAIWSTVAFGAALLDLIIPRVLLDASQDFSFEFFPDLTPLVFAIVFAVLAQVFKSGAEMREELETVV